MSTPRKQWLLKVIAGPHQGAEVILDAGKALVGSDDDCDVVLHDVLVAPQHLALELADSGIVAAPLGGRVFCNGKRIKEARQTIAEFTFLTIGGTHLVVGPAEGKWPLLSSADVPDLEKEAPVPEKVEVEKKEDATPAETSVVAETPVVSDGMPSKQVRRGAWINVALGCLLLIGSLVAWKMWGRPLLPATSTILVSTEKETELDRAQKIIKEIGAESSIKIEEQAGRLTATGYVETDSKQREIQSALRSAMPGMRARIWSLEKIASSARNFLIAQRLPLTVSSLPEGELTIGGTLATAEEWDRARQMLLTEIPGISGIDDKVQIGVQSAGIKSNPEAPRNTAAITPMTPLTVPTTAAPVLPKPVPADIVDLNESTVATINVRENDLGWVKLSDGGVYFLGGKFPSGALLVDITEQSVSVLDQGQKREVRLGEKIARSHSESPTSSHTLAPSGS